MKLKTYHAPTLHAALRLARIELGSEAVLLEAKEREAETAEARFQVTFALGVEGEVPPAPPPAKLEMPHWKSFLADALADPPAEPSNEPKAGASNEAPAEEPKPEPEPESKPRSRAARTKKRAAPKRPNTAAASEPVLPESFALPEALAGLRTTALAALFGRLASAGVLSSEAMALTSKAAREAGCDDDLPALEAALTAILDAGWRIHTAPEPSQTATRVIALAGPAGAGKSATAVRAALLLLHAYDRPVALVSLGRHPVGGVEALDAWATLLGLRLEIEESPERLTDVLDRLTAGPRPPGAILVDTTADLSAKDAVLAAKLETHLVLPAVYSAPDLTKTVERYASCAPCAAIYTRTDEAAAPGALWNLQRTSRLPASFLGCGPETPGDLRPATARRLTQRLLGR